ncbi:MAG: DUF4105 domain-containing protein [Myxococcota bacterium]
MHSARWLGGLATIATVATVGGPVAAQAAPEAPATVTCPEDLGPVPAVYLLTFGSDLSVETAFGHSALLLWEPARGQKSRVYDFGHFEVSDPVALVWGIATNDQHYFVGRQSLGRMLHDYGPLGRWVVAQRLALTPDEADALARSLEHTLRDEDSFPYNWYRPNCTTRIGDVLDETLGGALSAQHIGPSGTSRAREVERHAVNLPWLWFGLHWGSGHVADAELTRWESTFLPVRLMEVAATSTIRDQPLVTDTCELLPGWMPPIPDEAPNRDPALAAIGLGAAGALLGIDRASPRLGRAATGLLGVAVGLFGTAALLVGILGTFAPSWGAHNLAFASPLTLLVAVAAGWAARRPTSPVPARLVAAVVAIAAGGIVLALVRGFTDRNLGIVALTVPALLAAGWTCRPRPPSPR